MEFKKYEEKGAYHWESYEKNLHYREKTKKIVEKIGKDKKVLDIGCGDGLIAEKIGEKNTVIGIDNEKKAIELAKEKCENVNKIKKANALDLPFENEEFDVVLMADLIEHIKKEQELLKEAHRITKQNGEIIITTPLKRKDESFHDPKHHVREYSIQELKKHLSPFYKSINMEIMEKEKLYYVKKIGREISKIIPLRLLPRRIQNKAKRLLSRNKTIIYKGKKINSAR